MTVKEWLRRGRNLTEEIKTLTETRQTAFDVATSATASGTGEKVQASKSNTSEEKFLKYVEFSEEIDARIIKLQQTHLEIMNIIATVTDATDRIILTDYYINCLTLDQIAAKLNYSYKQICRRHKNALLKIKKCP